MVTIMIARNTNLKGKYKDMFTWRISFYVPHLRALDGQMEHIRLPINSFLLALCPSFSWLSFQNYKILSLCVSSSHFWLFQIRLSQSLQSLIESPPPYVIVFPSVLIHPYFLSVDSHYTHAMRASHIPDTVPYISHGEMRGYELASTFPKVCTHSMFHVTHVYLVF